MTEFFGGVLVLLGVIVGYGIGFLLYALVDGSHEEGDMEKQAHTLLKLLLETKAVYEIALDLAPAEDAQALVGFLRGAHIYKYPKADHTVDGVILQGGRVLLIRRGSLSDPFYGCWALPGGFLDVESGETLAEAFRREMKEELNLDNLLDIHQVGTFSAPNRDPRGRVISTVFKVELDPGVKVKAGDDAMEYRWFPLSNLPPLAFDHATILTTVL